MFRYFRSIVLLAAASMLAGTAFAAQPQTTQFNIPSQPLADALRAVAVQTSINVLFDPPLVADRIAPALHADLTCDQALSRLLAGTGLKFEFLSERTVTVVSESAGRSGNSAGLAEGKGVRLAQVDRPSPSGGEGQGEDNKEDFFKKNQNKGSEGSSEESDRASSGPLQEVVVTGTHIRGVAPDSSPVIVYTREDIERTGAATLDQFMRTVPQNLANIDSNNGYGIANNQDINANQSQGAAVNLRGLGAGATLVLVNGHRIAAGGRFGDQVDISLIPLAAIERIEILTDGASALYGADAIAGVVNYVSRKDFSGATTTLKYGDSTEGGGREVGASQVLGAQWSGGSGMFTYDYLDRETVRVEQRDFIVPNNGFNAKSSIGSPQERHGFSVFVQQTLRPGTTISADGLYAKRRYSYLAAANSTSLGGGVTDTFTAVASLRQDLFASWSANLSVNHSEMSLDAWQAIPAFNLFTPNILDTRLTFVDAIADGGVLDLPAGTIKASIGAHYREEKLNNSFVGAGVLSAREVKSAFAELFVPLIGADNATVAARRLELSLAARHDNYSSVGSDDTYKVGVLWAPVADVRFRGTYGTSFRAPSLGDLNPGAAATANVNQFPTPSGAFVPGIWLLGSSSNLQPETAKTFTLGLDYTPQALQGLNVSVGYYSIDYKDRLSVPPSQRGSLYYALFEQDVLASFINSTPTPQQIAAYYASPGFTNFQNVPAGNIQIVVDGRLINMSSSEVEGLDFSAAYDFELAGQRLRTSVSGQYMLTNDFKPLSTTPTVSLVDVLFQQPHLRARWDLGLDRGSFSANIATQYTDAYTNPLTTPSSTVDRWITFDLGLNYRVAEHGASLLRGTSVSLNVQNLFDRDPPRVLGPPPPVFNSTLGYDPANATYRGRFVSVQLSKGW